MIKRTLVRCVRKSAHLTNRLLSKGARFSGRVENKAHRIINGVDNSITLGDKVLFEKLYYESLRYITPIHPALPRAGRKPRTALFIPSLQKSSFFGGTATALFLAATAAIQANTSLLIIETVVAGHASEQEIKAFLKENNIVFKNAIEFADLSPRTYNNYGYIDIHPDDIFICSAWWDAYLLERLPLVKKFIYLIQDYEPCFYGNGDVSVLAEGTYHSERFVPICNTEIMLDYMRHKGYDYIAKTGLSFEPAMNVGKKLGVAKLKTGKEKKRLFIYGRPSVERNLFLMALRAVDEVFAEQRLTPSEWECYMAGQDGIADITLETGQTVSNMGKMSIGEYYEFAKTIDVGVSLMMAPHPNYPTLELSSMGAAVVTTQYETKKDLGRYSDNIITRPANLEQIKDAIVKAANMDPKVRIDNAKNSSLKSNWKEVLEPVVAKAIKKAVSSKL